MEVVIMNKSANINELQSAKRVKALTKKKMRDNVCNMNNRNYNVLNRRVSQLITISAGASAVLLFISIIFKNKKQKRIINRRL